MTKKSTFLISTVVWCILSIVYSRFSVHTGIDLLAYSLPAVVCFLVPPLKGSGEQRFQSVMLGYSACGAVVYLALFFLTGVFLKQISASPYQLSLSGIMTNLASIIPSIVVREITRSYILGMIRRYGRRRWQLTAVVLFMMITSLNLNKISSITVGEKLVIYLAVDLLPTLTQQILLTVLVYYGGSISGIVYQGLIEIFLHVFPVLPDLVWIAQSAISLTYPVFMAVFIRDSYGVLDHQIKRTESGTSFFYVQVLLAVAFCWFCVGVFPLYPSVILTGSMEPEIHPGDIVIIKKIKEEKEIYQLAAGDVINFKQDEITITHRILEVVYDTAGNVSFQTKGDNNQSPDREMVNPNNVNGMIVATIPKVGVPLLVFQSGERVPEGVVDYGENTME